MGLLDDAIREHLELKRSHGADPGEVARAEREALGPVRSGGDLAGEPHVDALVPEADLESRAPNDPRLGPPDDGLYDEETARHPTGGVPSPDVGAPHDRDIVMAGQETAEYDLGADAGDEHVDRRDAESPPETHKKSRSWVPKLSRVRGESARAVDASSADESPAPGATEAHPQSPAPGGPSAHGEPMAGGSPDLHAEPPAGSAPGAHAEPMAGAGAEHPPAEDVLEATPDFLRETPEHERLWLKQSPPRDFDFGR